MFNDQHNHFLKMQARNSVEAMLPLWVGSGIRTEACLTLCICDSCTELESQRRYPWYAWPESSPCYASTPKGWCAFAVQHARQLLATPLQCLLLQEIRPRMFIERAGLAMWVQLNIKHGTQLDWSFNRPLLFFSFWGWSLGVLLGFGPVYAQENHLCQEAEALPFSGGRQLQRVFTCAGLKTFGNWISNLAASPAAAGKQASKHLQPKAWGWSWQFANKVGTWSDQIQAEIW